ncbi:MAG TPA: hypothetical protein VF461_23140 [Gemmatimonadaceae bacterium]
MRRLGALLAILLTVGCGGSDTFDGPGALIINAVSASHFTAQTGDLLSVEINVDGKSDLSTTTATFVPSDGGSVRGGSIYLEPDGSGTLTTDGTAKVWWRVGAATKVQTLTVKVDRARPFTFQANVTGNGWTVTKVGSSSYATRLADTGFFSPAGWMVYWSATQVGSPPRLIISCQAGTVGIALTHPKLAPAFEGVGYVFDGVGVPFEHWVRSAPLSDSLWRTDTLFHPGPNTATGTLAKQIAASKSLGLVYLQFFYAGSFSDDVSPTFGTAGLSQVMPQVMANCPAGR